jgi:hypothetical protein
MTKKVVVYNKLSKVPLFNTSPTTISESLPLFSPSSSLAHGLLISVHIGPFPHELILQEDSVGKSLCQRLK